jgi:hypothetical protein
MSTSYLIVVDGLPEQGGLGHLLRDAETHVLQDGTLLEVAQLGTGRVAVLFGGSFEVVERTIRELSPRVVAVVGVGRSLRGDVAPGDVVVASTVWRWPSSGAGRLWDPAVRTSHRCQQRAFAEARRTRWYDRVDEAEPAPVPPDVHFGNVVVVAPGDVADEGSLGRYDACVVEERNPYSYVAVYHCGVEVLVVHGVTGPDGPGTAARNAMAFTLEVLARLF